METVYSIKPSKNYIIINVSNAYCLISCAEPNNHVIYRLVKATFKLYIKTFKQFLLNNSFIKRHQMIYEKRINE